MADAEAARYNSVLASLERALDFTTNDAFANVTLQLAKVKLDRLHQLFAEFNQSVLQRIETGTDEQRAEFQTKLNGIEDRWLNATANFHEKIAELDIQPVVAQQPQKVTVELKDQPGKLTRTWGIFEGDLLKWNGFRDRFTKAVHEKDMPDIDKFGYLFDSLRGRALKPIAGYQVTEDGYQAAWKAVCDYFGQSYNLAGAYLDKFYSMKRVSERPTSEELSGLAFGARELIRNMQQEKYNVDGWDIIVVHLCTAVWMIKLLRIGGCQLKVNKTRQLNGCAHFWMIRQMLLSHKHRHQINHHQQRNSRHHFHRAVRTAADLLEQAEVEVRSQRSSNSIAKFARTTEVIMKRMLARILMR